MCSIFSVSNLFLKFPIIFLNWQCDAWVLFKISLFKYCNINWRILVLWALLFILLANCWECLVRGYTWLEQLEPLLLNVTSYPPPTLQTLQGFQNFQQKGFSMFYCCIQIYHPLLKHYRISYQHFQQADFQIVHVFNNPPQGTLKHCKVSKFPISRASQILMQHRMHRPLSIHFRAYNISIALY
jgi:hypothetical protein